jgi:uncharacterized protein YigE (DUF2233 family)
MHDVVKALVCSILMVVSISATPEKKVVDGVTYHVIRASAASVRIIWKDRQGNPLRTFPAAAKYFEQTKVPVETLMNGGIFEPGGVPSGLLIQDGRELNPVNRNKGEGNFYLQPNGIFIIGSAGADVIRTDEYPPKDITIQHAVQSGPLLMRHGKIHPAFNSGSENRLHRNGVGVSESGEVIFAMTDFDSPKFPNLFEFTQLFRLYGCDDALFLDGDLCQMRSGKEMAKPSNRFGSIIAIEGKENVGSDDPGTFPGVK